MHCVLCALELRPHPVDAPRLGPRGAGYARTERRRGHRIRLQPAARRDAGAPHGALRGGPVARASADYASDRASLGNRLGGARAGAVADRTGLLPPAVVALRLAFGTGGNRWAG